MPSEPRPPSDLNRPPAALPGRCDVLVVGAGPAGSAAACRLAAAGLDVVMVDAHAFPRDKVCGDALLSDAQRALERLGVLEQVLARAEPVSHVAVLAPLGGRLEVPARIAVLPRRELDLLLVQAALRAGARLFAPLRYGAPIETPGPDGPRVTGAELQAGGRSHRIEARWTLLATGAAPQALQAAGMVQRRTPSGISLRGYLRHPTRAPVAMLEMVWHRQIRSGYGWVFPGPGGVHNVGIYVTDSHRAGKDGRHAMQDINLREAFDRFGALHAPLRALLDGGEWVGPLKGAPVRCSLTGSTPSRPGLMVIGEAVGTTYLLSGEGIGKAMDTGLLAAEAITIGGVHGLTDPEGDDARVRLHYGQGLAALQPLSEAYTRGNVANHQRWLVDLLVWRANRSPRLAAKLAAVLDERHTPRRLLGAGSWWRLLAARA
jgi:menaquinone-9 beta-reductase